MCNESSPSQSVPVTHLIKSTCTKRKQYQGKRNNKVKITIKKSKDHVVCSARWQMDFSTYHSDFSVCVLASESLVRALRATVGEEKEGRG